MLVIHEFKINLSDIEVEALRNREWDGAEIDPSFIVDKMRELIFDWIEDETKAYITDNNLWDMYETYPF